MTIILRTDPISMKFNSGSEVVDVGTWTPTQAKDNYDKAIAKLNQSPKAKTILQRAESAEEVVYVLVTKDMISKYFSPDELKKKWCTILPSNASLIVWDPVSVQPIKTIKAHKPKFLEYMEDSRISTKVNMSPFMILIHEFGHFMQFLELPHVYEIMRDRSYTEAAQKIKKTDNAIEDENVQHFEAPVAYELGEPVRFQYWDQ